jgi:ferritin-like protein
MAALIVAFANAVLAVLVMLVAARIKPGPEEEMVKEIRELALTELSADADEIKQSFAQIGSDIERIRSGFSSVSGVLGSAQAGLGSLSPVLGLLTGMLKNKGK